MKNKKQVKWTVQGEQTQTQIRRDMGVEEGGIRQRRWEGQTEILEWSQSREALVKVSDMDQIGRFKVFDVSQKYLVVVNEGFFQVGKEGAFIFDVVSIFSTICICVDIKDMSEP